MINKMCPSPRIGFLSMGGMDRMSRMQHVQVSDERMNLTNPKSFQVPKVLPRATDNEGQNSLSRYQDIVKSRAYQSWPDVQYQHAPLAATAPDNS